MRQYKEDTQASIGKMWGEIPPFTPLEKLEDQQVEVIMSLKTFFCTPDIAPRG